MYQVPQVCILLRRGRRNNQKLCHIVSLWKVAVLVFLLFFFLKKGMAGWSNFSLLFSVLHMVQGAARKRGTLPSCTAWREQAECAVVFLWLWANQRSHYHLLLLLLHRHTLHIRPCAETYVGPVATRVCWEGILFLPPSTTQFYPLGNPQTPLSGAIVGKSLWGYCHLLILYKQ